MITQLKKARENTLVVIASMGVGLIVVFLILDLVLSWAGKDNPEMIGAIFKGFRVLKIDCHDKGLESVTKLACFEGIKPGMSISQVVEILGQADISGKDDDIGSYWIYNRSAGKIICSSLTDGADINMIEYGPRDNKVTDFLVSPKSNMYFKGKVAVYNGDSLLLNIYFDRSSKKVNGIFWYKSD